MSERQHLRQQLLVSFFGAFSSVFLVSVMGVIAWYSFVNTEIALLRQSFFELGSKVERLTDRLEKADLGGLIVRVGNHEYRIQKVETKLENL
jgi:hypothetical protein